MSISVVPAVYSLESTGNSCPFTIYFFIYLFVQVWTPGNLLSSSIIILLLVLFLTFSYIWPLEAPSGWHVCVFLFTFINYWALPYFKVPHDVSGSSYIFPTRSQRSFLLVMVYRNQDWPLDVLMLLECHCLEALSMDKARKYIY